MHSVSTYLSPPWCQESHVTPDSQSSREDGIQKLKWSLPEERDGGSVSLSSGMEQGPESVLKKKQDRVRVKRQRDQQYKNHRNSEVQRMFASGWSLGLAGA